MKEFLTCAMRGGGWCRRGGPRRGGVSCVRGSRLGMGDRWIASGRRCGSRMPIGGAQGMQRVVEHVGRIPSRVPLLKATSCRRHTAQTP